MTDASGFPDLDLNTGGCPVCNVASRALFDSFAQLQYALAEDEDTRRRHAAAGGFCPLHSWQLAALSSSVGLAVTCEALVEHAANALDKTMASGPTSAIEASSEVVRTPAGPHTCAACQAIAQARTHAIQRLAGLLATMEGQTDYARSGGVCRPDLAKLLSAIPAPDGRRWVLLDAVTRFHQLENDLRTYIDLRESGQRGKLTRDQLDAPRRALIHLVGAEELYASRRF